MMKALCRKLPRWAFACVFFLSVYGKGAFFNLWCIVLNLSLLLYFLLCRKRVVFDRVFFALLGLFGSALVSSFFLSGNLYTAMSEGLKYALYPLAYLFFKSFHDKRLIENILFRSTVFLAVGGLLAFAGMTVMPNMVIESSGRLQSFLQYANTTALLLGLGILMAVDRFLTSKKWMTLLALAVLIPAFYLTKSRIGFWIFALVLMLYVFSRLKRRGRIIFAGCAAVTLLAVALVGSRIMRISLFEVTLVERWITYTDALRILATHPFGIGPGDWQFEHLVFQSAPYYVKYIHCVFLQILLDCGVIGLVCFLYAVVPALIGGLRKAGLPFFALLLMLMTSALDVHFSFGVVIVFAMYFLSALTPERRGAEAVIPPLAPRDRPLRLITLLPVLALSVFLLSESLIFWGKSMNTDNAARAFNAAKALNPMNNAVYLELAKAERRPDAALEHLERGYAANPLDWSFQREMSQGYAYVGDFEKSLQYAQLYFETHRYSAESQKNLLDLLERAYHSGYYSTEAYETEKLRISDRISDINAEINPLYRYIDPDMRY